MSEDDSDTGAVGRKTIRRVRNFSIFFLGIGLYAVAGWAMEYNEIFTENAQTYFAVGAAIGGIGILLFLVSQW